MKLLEFLMKQMQRSKEKHRRSGHFGGADAERLVRLLSANFTNHETVLRLEYEGSGRNVGKCNTRHCRAGLRGDSDTPYGQGV